MQRITSLNRKRNHAVKFAAAAALMLMAGGKAARADVQVTSFENGGFDYAGDGGITAVQDQTTGVTDGSNSLHITSGQSWWQNLGFIALPAADFSSNTVLKFDITTSAADGVNFNTFFHPDSSIANPYGSSGPGPSNWTYVGPGLSQTISIDYSTVAIPASGSYDVNFQTSTGNPLDFYIDNVRLTGAIPVLDTATGQWTNNGSGNWVDPTHWNAGSPGLIPGGIGSQVTFGTNGGAITTTSQIVVTLTQAVNAMNMTFDKGDGGYKITGNYPINVSANFIVNSGTHEITSPVAVAPNTIANVAANSALTIDNLTVNGYNYFEKQGDGTLTVDKIVNCSLGVVGGNLTFLPGNAQNNGFIYALTVSNGSQFVMNGAHMRVNGIFSAGTPGGIDLGTGGVLTSAEFDNYGFYGTITGAGSMIIGGESTTPHVAGLFGSNSYTGTTTVTNGNTLQASAPEGLGDGSPTNYLILDNGTFQATGNLSTSRRVNVTALGGTIDTGTFDVGFGVVDSGTFTKAGTGTLTVTRLDTVPMANVTGGVLKIAPNGTATGASTIGNLTLAGGTSLDLTNNRLIVTGSDFATVKAKVLAGYNGGDWAGAGITSSTAASVAADATNTHKTALGYATAGDLGIGSFGGQSVNPTDVLVRCVFVGDANLDGVVNAMDFNTIAANFGKSSQEWDQGDFTLDGSVTTADFTALATNFNQALPNPAPSFAALVPEPASMFMVMLGGMLCARRRR